MGILRADRITGLGGANAIKGSVFFNRQPSSFLRTDIDDTNYVLGTDDFTLELWHNTPTLETTNGLIMFGPGGYGYYNSFFHFSGADVQMYISSNGTSWDIAQATKIGERVINTWHHYALTREGNTFRGFIDGVLGATFTSSGAIRQGASEFNKNSIMIGHRITTTLGHISNFRYIKGRAVYTAAFTPPTNELEVTSDTILLCCQSPSNILQEATGKTLIAEAGGSSNAVSAAENVGPPVASRFTPNTPVGFSTTTDVGSQYGTTFDGFGNFVTSTYMVPPGGNTRERNRGRAVFMGGSIHPVSPSFSANIDYVEMTTSGVGVRFGSLTTVNSQSAAFASSTRGINAGGQTASPDAQTNIIEFVTIATEGNGTNFGDLDTGHRRLGGSGHSSQTRGIITGGAGDSPGETNVIQFVTIASIGNATDFGDLLNPKDNMMSKNGSSTRMLICGGRDYTPSATATNVIEYITIATTGNSADFGDLTQTRFAGTGCSSATRGIIAGGQTPTYVNTIDYVTIASTANATDFGDLTATISFLGGASNSIKGIFAGGATPTKLSTIQSIEIATTGNAVAFGDNTATNPVTSRGTCSDSHGGLS